MADSKFDIEEFKEAFAHYRHLEQQRSQQLVFFFTMVGAFMAVIGYLFKEDSSKFAKPEMFWVLMVMMLFIQLLATTVLVSIRRLGDARGRHEWVIGYQRGKLQSDPKVALVWAQFPRARWLSNQGAAEIIVHLLALSFLLGTLVGGQTIYGKDFCSWPYALLGIFQVIFLLYHLIVSFKLEPERFDGPSAES